MAGKQSKVDKLVEEVSGLSVLELSDLVKALQEKLGVTPAPFGAGQGAMPSGGAPTSGEAAQEQVQASGSATATVVLTESGANKIGVIKALREINPQLGLKEAKDITEATPKEILENAKAEDAKAAKEKLEAAGAKVELK